MRPSQGWRTAQNANLPFVVVGRKLPHHSHHTITRLTLLHGLSLSSPQGWRTAQNADLPFVVVGRKLSPDLVKKTLGPLAEAKRRGEKLTSQRSNFDPSDRTAGLSPADARGADIAGAWRAGAARGFMAARAGAGGGGGEGEE